MTKEPPKPSRPSPLDSKLLPEHAPSWSDVSAQEGTAPCRDRGATPIRLRGETWILAWNALRAS